MNAAAVTAIDSTARFSPRFWERYDTDGLRAVRARLDSVLDYRARQFGLFEVPAPAPSEAAGVCKQQASPGASTDIAEILSPSQLNCFLDCQSKWYYRHVLKLPDVRSSNLALGSAVHAALAENFAQKIETKRDLEATGVLALFIDAFERELESTTLTEEDNLEDLRATGLLAVDTYMSDVAPRVNPAAVELHVTGAIAGVQVQGYIDLLDVEGRIIDIKTAKKKPSGVRPDYRRQVATYAALEPQSNGFARVDTLVKTKTMQLVEQTIEITPADTKSIEVLYPLAQESMRSGLYTPNRGSMLCSRKYCPYADRCVADFGGVVG